MTEANEHNEEEEMLALPLGFGSVSLASLAEQHKDALAEIEAYDPLRLAAAFGGLLAVPTLQANCLRLEILTHLSLAFARGTRKPTPRLVSSLFSDFGSGKAGWMEDPAEDIFVSNLATPRGNFRIFEGIWEAAGFHTQRVINTLEMAPDGAPYDGMRNSIYGLLKLSNEICERSGLVRNVVGASEPKSALSKTDRDSLSSKRRNIRFTEQQLRELGIELDDLAVFGFDPSKRGQLSYDVIGHSKLERYPIVYRNGEVHFLLPTAASAAIRRYIYERMEGLSLRTVFAGALAMEYAKLISGMPLLGQSSGAELEFRETDNGLISGISTKADEGFFVNFVFVSDSLEGFEDGGLVGMLPVDKQRGLFQDIEKWIDHAYEEARQSEGFRGGLSLVVACGLGRGMVHNGAGKARENWQIEFIGAPDLITLCRLHGFNTLSLLRILEGREKVAEIGVELQNINGLLNMVAWSRMLGGHLVPHANLPDGFGSGDGHSFIMIEQNGLLQLRQEVANAFDGHVCQNVSGRWLPVFKEGKSYFQEDRNKPYYMCVEVDSRWPMGVYKTSKRSWWVELETVAETPGYLASQRHEMLRTWLRIAAPVLDKAFDSTLPPVVLWKAIFEGHIGNRPDPNLQRFLDIDEAMSHIGVEIDGAMLIMPFAEEFELSLLNPENIGECALVTRLIEGFATMAGADLSELEKQTLLGQIVKNSDARQAHAFIARCFRDFVQSSVPTSPIKIDADDAAIFKLGLGWRLRDRAEGGEIEGKSECTDYLNSVVKLLEDEVCEELRSFDRNAVIKFALINHESAAVDRDRWRRTSRALIALHDNKDAARQTIIDREFELNAVFHASRLMIEFAICECPILGGGKPGKRDMSRLMAKILTLSGLGGWSDAIHWDAMEPRIVVRPLGDIHANVSFHEEVLTPFSREAADVTVSASIEKYPEHFREAQIIDSDRRDTLDNEFWEAFEEQFGAKIDTARQFIDALENLGIQRNNAVFKMKKTELHSIKLEEKLLDRKEVAALVEFLTFKGRLNWRDVPEGFNAKDIFPWRYRRALTVLRRPLIQLDDLDEDPDYIVAPGLLRDAFVYMVSNYHKGDFPRWQLKPKMKRWAGKSRDKIGSQFAVDVSTRLRELGWETETEVAVTKLLAKGFDRDYGDVDVLAWKPDAGRVLLVECKDLQYRKTDGEVAEQLSDYRGQIKNDGKPDDLLKHLNRIELIARHNENVMRYLKLMGEPKIEGHLVFRNPVPMRYAWEHLSKKISLNLFSTIDKL